MARDRNDDLPEDERGGEEKRSRTIRRYTVVHPGKPKDDARRFLDQACCWELESLAERLEFCEDREESWDLAIEKVDGEIHTLTVCGGVFGDTVVLLYFAVLQDREEVVVLGVAEGEMWLPPPKFRSIKMRNRLSHYRRIAD